MEIRTQLNTAKGKLGFIYNFIHDYVQIGKIPSNCINVFAIVNKFRSYSQHQNSDHTRICESGCGQPKSADCHYKSLVYRLFGHDHFEAKEANFQCRLVFVRFTFIIGILITNISDIRLQIKSHSQSKTIISLGLKSDKKSHRFLPHFR